MDGRKDGWMDERVKSRKKLAGRMDGRKGGKAGLRIAYNNQKSSEIRTFVFRFWTLFYLHTSLITYLPLRFQ